MEEETLIILKPDCIEKKCVGQVLERFERAGFCFAQARVLRLEGTLLREHYAHIAQKPFFPEVEAFMTRCPLLFFVLRGKNVVERVRDLLGPTDSKKADKGTIRGDFGTDVMHNIAHASDSLESAALEIQRFFGKR